MNDISPAFFDGKHALIEVRSFRRSHRVVIAALKKEPDGVYAVFREAYRPEFAKIRIPEAQLSHFIPAHHKDYDLRLNSVLYRSDDQSEDTAFWERPPIIVTQADIEAEKKKEANQQPEPTRMDDCQAD